MKLGIISLLMTFHPAEILNRREVGHSTKQRLWAGCLSPSANQHQLEMTLEEGEEPVQYNVIHPLILKLIQKNQE